MKKINDSKIVRRLALLCALTYVASYLTRINFAAVTVEIIRETGWEKSAISVVTTALFISYGIGQLISGWLGDHTKPQWLMTGGLCVSALMNVIIPFCGSNSQMAVIWYINGLAQAMMWPPIVRILAGYCRPRDYQTSTMIVSWGCSVGTIIVYLLASLCTEYTGWRVLFYICAAAAVATATVWVVGFNRVAAFAESEKNTDTVADQIQDEGLTGEKQRIPGMLIAVLAAILLAVVILGALRDSITAWLPSYISETFSLGSSSAILTSIVLPIFTTATYPLVLSYYRRFFKSELLCSATIYALAAASALLLYFFFDLNAIVSVLLLAVIAACMHGANFLIIGLIPKKFDKYGCVSTISGVINSFVYVGSSLSIWGIAVIAERFGWSVTIIVWGVLGLAGMLLCLSVARKFQSFFTVKK